MRIICSITLQKNNMSKQKIVNILGEEESDPIYDLLNCYHRFSLHGHIHIRMDSIVYATPSKCSVRVMNQEEAEAVELELFIQHQIQ
jgi:hypothetical protein